MDYRLTPHDEAILLMTADIVAKKYHMHRHENNARYKPKPDHDGSEAYGLRMYVLLSRRAREIDKEHYNTMKA